MAELTPAARDELLAGKYRLLARVGRGGMADVFLGSADGPAGLNKLVVIKRLRDGFGEDPSYVGMFLDEARISARMNHPNIVHTFEAERVGQEYIIVMEYLEGQPLRHLLREMHEREQHCSPELAAHLMAQALSGLHYVHEMKDYDGTSLGIVHRDISPQNLFVTYDGQVKVLDFGIAKATLNSMGTQDGVVKGKFAYMSPEQANAEAIDRRSDVFSAGVVLWELLTGQRLFRGETAGTLMQILTAPIPAPSSLAPEVPPELDRIVQKALERSPEARFGSALEMSEALSELVSRSAQPVRHQDIARLMQGLFGEAREEIATRILEYMNRRASEAVPLLDEMSDAMPTHARHWPEPPVESPVPAVAASRSRRGRALGALLVVGVAALSSALLWKRVRSAAPHHAAPHARTRATASESDVEPSFHLALSSDPVEAQVEWSGKVVGQTPILIDLDPGPQTFVLRKAGHVTVTVVVNVTRSMAGRTESRTAVMAKREAEPRAANDASFAPPVRMIAIGRVHQKPAPDSDDPSDGLPATDNAFVPPSSAEQAQLAGRAAAAVPVALVRSPLPTQPVPPAPAPPVVSTVLPFGPEMTRPTLLSGEPLIFPREAQLAHVSGAIIARCTITAEGALRACRIIKGLPFLDQPILDSLATRRYTPVLAQGKPVSVQYIFNLKVESPS